MVIGIRNKKGDVTISTVIWIVLGVAVLVMMVIGFTKGWGFFFDWFDKGPSELQSLAEVCSGYASAGLSIDFCTYRMAGDEIVNCRDYRITKVLDDKGVKYSTITCSVTASNLADLCSGLSESKRNSIKVNSAPNGCLGEDAKKCGGTPKTCNNFDDSKEVCEAAGCTYGTDDKCTGTPKVCASYSAESACEMFSGCTWA